MLGQSERSGVLVISAWTEGDGSQLRVRITSGSAGGSAPEWFRVVSSASLAGEIVHAWLVGLISPSRPPDAGQPKPTPSSRL